MRTETKKQQSIGLKELRENMEKYIDRIQNGESITIFRRSKPIFRLSPVDADEGEWETVVDFTLINKEGVSALEILKRLKKIHG
jgi:prevent-host-death family protein